MVRPDRGAPRRTLGVGHRPLPRLGVRRAIAPPLLEKPVAPGKAAPTRAGGGPRPRRGRCSHASNRQEALGSGRPVSSASTRLAARQRTASGPAGARCIGGGAARLPLRLPAVRARLSQSGRSSECRTRRSHARPRVSSRLLPTSAGLRPTCPRVRAGVRERFPGTTIETATRQVARSGSAEPGEARASSPRADRDRRGCRCRTE